MANLNKVMLIGRLTRDPKSRSLPSGSKVVAFGFAVNNRRKNQQTGAWEDEPVFLDCEAWSNGGREGGGRQTGDLVEQYLKKGHQAYIEGHLRLDQWTDKNDGSKRSKLKLVVDNVQFLEPRSDGGNQEGGGNYQQRPARTMSSAPPARSAPPAYSPPANSNYDEQPMPDHVEEQGGDDIPF
jgi:single-strand DNA-binding protein